MAFMLGVRGGLFSRRGHPQGADRGKPRQHMEGLPPMLPGHIGLAAAAFFSLGRPNKGLRRVPFWPLGGAGAARTSMLCALLTADKGAGKWASLSDPGARAAQI